MSDWNKKIFAHEFYKLALDGFPNWDKPNGTEPVELRRSIVHNVDRSSHDIAVEVDDWCEGKFYFRDFTTSGLPFVDDGEVYQCVFIFEKECDVVEFDARYPNTQLA